MGLKAGGGMPGLHAHAAYEWVTLANQLSLIMGFAMLANQVSGFDDHSAQRMLRRQLDRAGRWRAARR
jgi:hypothetical protein